jgi:amino acid adenylation domain-containing protein
MDDLRSAGAAVVLVGADIGTRTGAKAALEAVARTGLRLGGVVHAAGVIEDALIVNLTVEQIRRVFNGKALGALHLHELTQSLPLDFFVLYSSVAAALGTPGQAHYTAANRVLEAIAAIRRSRGLPATAIALGAIGDAGYLTRRQDVARYIIGAGIQPLATATALAALGAVLRRAPMNVAFAEIDWSKLAQSFALVTASARTSGLVRSSAAGDSGPDRQVRSAILASPEAQRPAVVSDYLHGKVAMVLKVDPGSVEIDRPLREIGLDSLTAFELKNRIETELGVTLPVGQFLQRPTISALVPAVIASLASNAGGHAATTEADGLGLGISIGQEALWFIDRLAPGNPAYGLAACVSFRPHVDDGHIDKIIQSLVLQNENLRFAFPSDGLGPVPNLLPPDQYRLIRHDATHLSEVEFSGLLHAEANRPFHLGEGPLSRLHLFRRSDCDVMLLQFHHIVADAASIAILLDDVLEGYFALQAGLPLPTRQHAPFRRFIAWQRAVVAGPQGERHRRYWRQTLAGAPPSLLLATDHPRALDSLGPGASRSFIMKGVIVEELKGLARAEGTTLFSLLLAAFNVLLHRYSGATDIIVGTPVSGRTQSDFERMVGYLVNAMPIRAQVSPDRSFQAVLADVDAAIRSSLEHQDYPFSTIVEDLDPPRQQGCFPFFQIMFGMERFDSTDPRGLAATLLNMAGPAITYREYTVESVAVSRSRAPFDMTFTIEEFDNQIFGVVDYRCDLWEGHSIDRLIEHYEAILHQVVASPLRRISELTLGRPAAQPMRGRALLDRPDVMTSLQQVVAAVPDGIAVSDAAGDLSYRTLLRRIDGLASTMANRGIGRGSRVAICLGRTRELPIALLATLATGAAYIPLDPSYPRARLAAIIDDAKPDIVVADRDGVALLPADTSALLAESCVEAATAFASARIEANDLAYIIHTSGSTGRPVGVEIGRGALANFLAAMRAELPLSSTDSLLAVTPYSFDIAVLELLLPLTLGARVVIADEVVARDGRLLDARLDRGDVTLMQATPATWQMLIDGGWKGTGRLTALCGGEMLAPSLAAGILARGASLWNLYGPTETTVWSTLARVVDARAISIGRPIADTSCLVVDDTLQPVGAGIVGELLIGGAGLAHGYHNDPVRTAERFIPDPVDPDGRRVFRTGDLVRVQPDGMLQFVGRRDQQIKLRGFRVELGEIEAMLGQHPSVRSAAVLAVGDDLDSRRLVAFVEADERAAEHGLAAHLRKRLPSYMVPDAIRLTAAIPRLPNGKVDRRRLADEARLPPQRALASARPSTPVETQLVALLEELMRHASIGLHDNFFSIGGTSLLGMRYVARINDVYGVGIGASELMRAPTVASMAQLIAGLVAGAIPETGDRAVRMDTPIGRRLWRPLAMARAEGAFDEIDAAAIACLPDDLLEIARRNGAEAAVRGRLPRADDPQWGAVCRLKRGTIALVVVPRFEIDLIGDQATAVGAVEAAMDYARRLGARTVSLTGIIPAVTDFGRALTPCHGVAVTTGQATTASAVALSAIAAAQAAQRDMQHETIAFVGLGGIGAATLRLLLDQAIHPSALLLCDLPARQSELERLADEVRTDAGYRGDIEVALANGAIPAQVYGSRFIIGGASFPGVLEIDRLAAGTIVIDDAAPRRFDTDRAISRMTSRGDVLLVEGDLVSPPGAIDWTVTLPASVPALGHYPATGLLSDSSAITGCVLASLISQDPDVPTTTGPLTPAICRDHWEALRRMGIGAAPLRCGSWFPNRAYLARFGDLYARPGG